MFPDVNSEKAQNAIIRGGCLSAGCGKQGGGLAGHIAWACLWVLVQGKIRAMPQALWDIVHRLSENRARKIALEKSCSENRTRKIVKSCSKNRVGRTTR